jgi:hypothetical protein
MSTSNNKRGGDCSHSCGCKVSSQLYLTMSRGGEGGRLDMFYPLPMIGLETALAPKRIVEALLSTRSCIANTRL